MSAVLPATLSHAEPDTAETEEPMGTPARPVMTETQLTATAVQQRVRQRSLHPAHHLQRSVTEPTMTVTDKPMKDVLYLNVLTIEITTLTV